MTDKIIRCPRCRKSTRYHDSNPWRPFCSERCKTIDIAAWASEEYRLDGGPADPEDLPPLGEEDEYQRE